MDTYATPPSLRLPPGTRLNGVFEVERLIASGGMGEIYRGHVIETGDAVAIKVMRLDVADNAFALALFRKEASALHNIHHEAIVRYYLFSHDAGTGRHYLAMEFVDGLPLSDLLQQQGPLGLNDVHVLQQRLAAGLDAAHQHGIVHRDLSPDNVLIPGRDPAKAKIIDFGIARSTRGDKTTIIGSAFAGKYNYVSPEQLGLFGGDVTAKSDIYSLGLVLAACLTGRPLDMSGSQFEVIEKRRIVPDLTAIDRRYRPLLEAMLQPEPANRPESMAAVAAWRPESGAVRGRDRAAEPATGLRSGPSRSGRRMTGALALVLLMGVGAGLGTAGWYFEDIGAMVTEWFKPSQRPPPPVDRRQRIIDFINAYNGGDCFFITPETVDRDDVVIEGLGRAGGNASLAPFNALISEFKNSFGFEATVNVHQVTAKQCPAVDFLFQMRLRPDSALRLDIVEEKVREEVRGELRKGVRLTGTISGAGGGIVTLLHVADDGYVFDRKRILNPNGATQTFEQKIFKDKAGTQPHLLIAVASSEPLRWNGDQAEALFPQLTAAAAVSKMLHARAKYVILTE